MHYNSLPSNEAEGKISLALQIIIIFCFGRVLSLSIGDIGLLGINVIQMYGIFFSYIFIIVIGFNLRKLQFDFILLAILLFTFYCVLSLTWGTNQIKELSKIILPYTAYLTIRCIRFDNRSIRYVLLSFILGYLIPIIGSAYLILKGTSIAHVDYYSGVERATGMWSLIHPFAHSMLFFSFLYAFGIANGLPKKRLYRWVIHIIFLLSIFCLIKSYTRTTYIGFALFWGIFLFKFNKKAFCVFMLGILLILGLYHERIQLIFLKTANSGYTVDAASSGRITLWTHNLEIFGQSSIQRKLLGYGIGSESNNVIGGDAAVWSSHNDYLSVLMTLGLIGFVLYILIYAVLLIDILKSKIDKKNKHIYTSMVVVVIIMGLISNGYLYRFDLSQSFWLLIGFFYEQKYRVTS